MPARKSGPLIVRRRRGGSLRGGGYGGRGRHNNFLIDIYVEAGSRRQLDVLAAHDDGQWKKNNACAHGAERAGFPLGVVSQFEIASRFL